MPSAEPVSLPNPVRAEPGWPPAVIAGAFQTGVLGVRSLTRRRVRVTSFDCNPHHPGFRSVHGRAHLCPNPDREPQAWLRFMVDLSASLGARPVLISSSDQYVTAIAAHAQTLGEHYILSPGWALQGLLADKQTQYELAAAHGMPMPRTEFATSEEEVIGFGASARFPCLLKPTHFRQWQRFPPGHPLACQKIAIAAGPQQLLAH